MNNVIANLPAKGEKRLKAILELGKDETNAETLMALVETEKGNNKTAALKSLALLNYKPAAALWKKYVTGKYMGEDVLMPSCSDCVSDQIAPVISQYFSFLFELPIGAALNNEQIEKLKFSISIMLGKASTGMLDVYRLAAANTNWIRHMQKEKTDHEDADFWSLNELFIRIWNAAPNELEKIFPVVLSASIIKTKDNRLMNLADELYAKYGGCWLIPVFIKSILTKPKEEVYDEFSRFLSDVEVAIYLYNAFGMLYYEDVPKAAEKSFKNIIRRHYALIFWGNYSHGKYDTRCSFKQPVELDKRWLFDLAKNPREEKPKVAFQTYNRRMGGVKYEAYDEMLLELLPLEMEAGELKQALSDYFLVRSKADDGETSLYRDAQERFS